MVRLPSSSLSLSLFEANPSSPPRAGHRPRRPAPSSADQACRLHGGHDRHRARRDGASLPPLVDSNERHTLTLRFSRPSTLSACRTSVRPLSYPFDDSPPDPSWARAGNTCYMNSTVQVLRAIPELQDALNSLRPPPSPPPPPPSHSSLTLTRHDAGRTTRRASPTRS